MPGFLETEIGKVLTTFIISMLPVIELRGAIPWGYAHGLSWPVAAAVAVIGNMLPVPFILLFVRTVFKWLRKQRWVAKQISKLENRALLKAASVRKYELLGLAILVAIPLPGTGAWTGALIAALLDMRLRSSVPAILIGVIIAAVIVSGMTYGFFDLIVMPLT